MFQGCVRDVSAMFKRCLSDVLAMFYECVGDMPKMFLKLIYIRSPQDRTVCYIQFSMLIAIITVVISIFAIYG